MVDPRVRSLNRGPGTEGGFGQTNGDIDDFPLHGPVVGSAAWTAEGKVGEHKAGHSALFDNVSGTSDHDSGNADVLQMAGDQTHGLMTDRSERDQQHQVDIILPAPDADLFGVGHGETLTVAGGYTEESIVDLADSAVGSGVGQGA